MVEVSCRELLLAEPPAPVGSQTAVGRAGDRVFVDPGSGREKSGNKIVGRGIGPAGNDGTPHVKGFQQAEVRLKAPYGLFRLHLYEVIINTSPNVDGNHPQGLVQVVGATYRFVRRGGEVQFHLPLAVIGCQEPAAGVKPCLLLLIQKAFFPQNVSARQGRVTAQVDFHSGREPTQIKALFLPRQKGGFRQVHLTGNVLHPSCVTPFGQNADGRRIPGKGLVREGIHLKDLLFHRLSLPHSHY
jgi:hypothetical protein